MKKRKLRKGILKVLLLIFSLIFVYSLFNIFVWFGESESSKKIKEEIDDKINIDVSKGVFEVDFDELSKMNSDTVAYLIVNNTNVSYPVVKTNNDDFYLNHSFNKSKSEAGWVFMDSNNKFDGSDKNIVIYGHNRLDGIMFGSLSKVLNSDWYSNDENLNIKLIDKNGVTNYKIFSMYKVEEEEYYINTNFENINYSQFINNISKRSVHNFGDDLTNVNQILTLSTCTIVDGYRLVVHAYKV